MVKTKFLRIAVILRQNKHIGKLIIYLKELYDKTSRTNSQIKRQFLQFLPFLVASSVSGFIAYLYSRIFSYSEKLSEYFFGLYDWSIFILTPICFLGSWWLAKRYSPYAKGSGIPQVMTAIELCKPGSKKQISKLLGIKIILIKILSSSVKVIGGGVAGREGPTIQVTSSVFNLVHKYLPSWCLPISQSNALIAGAASGLAAAFNTPLGGIIFAIEELSKFHIKYYKSPLFIAVIISGLVAQGFGGSYLYLGYPNTQYDSWKIFVGIIIVTFLAAYFSSVMCKVLLRFMKFFNSFKNHKKQAFIVFLSGLLVATSIYFLGSDAMGSGKGLMEKVLFTSDKNMVWYMPFVRMSGLVSSFGIGGAGGVFAPSLSAGATFGAVIANWFDLTGGNANILVLVGMTAFLTGVTRAPFTSAIIMFEMTDRHSIIFFLLFSAILSNIVCSYVSRKSFYETLKEQYIQELSY